MRHRKAGRKLGMDSSARDAMFRNMVTSLMLHGQIKTTVTRAKELRRFADKVISLGKNARAEDANKLHAIRRARLWVNNDEALDKVFGEYAERFANRPGGYTRIIKAGHRPGDNAPMAIISLVEALELADRLVPDNEETAEPVAAKGTGEE